MTRLLTSAEVSSILGVSKETVLDYIHSGKLQSSFIGNRHKFTESDLQQFIHNHRGQRKTSKVK